MDQIQTHALQMSHEHAAFATAVHWYLTSYRRSDLWDLAYLIGQGVALEEIAAAADQQVKAGQPKPSLYAIRRGYQEAKRGTGVGTPPPADGEWPQR